MEKELFSAVILKGGETRVSLLSNAPSGRAGEIAERASGRGADGILVFDLSEGDLEHDLSLTEMREMARRLDIPIWGCGNIRRVEDVKKILYAGSRKALLNFSKDSNREMLKEVSERFGKEKIGAVVSPLDPPISQEEAENLFQYASVLLVLLPLPESLGRGAMRDYFASLPAEIPKLFFLQENSGEMLPLNLLSSDSSLGFGIGSLGGEDVNFYEKKRALQKAGFQVNSFEPAFSWDDLKKDSNGLVPVVVCDFRNEEVLMVAYMNQEAYEETFRTGIMTYFSRSRKSLWVKGESSGHFQYLKLMKIDCDNDTLLAKVFQVGAACHTGNRSCFYRNVVEKNLDLRNPMKVFEDVYGVIEDRKEHPKEGSYTSYLFEKGIDKILKKCGEEAAEIIIAAKNPNAEEIKYEIADFLYHVMVLMSEKGITWADIATELANRE